MQFIGELCALSDFVGPNLNVTLLYVQNIQYHDLYIL